MTRKLCLLVPLVAALAFGCKSSDHTADVMANTTCPMSGKAVNTATYYEYNGTKIYTCCEKCVAGVKADPKAAMAKAYPAH